MTIARLQRLPLREVWAHEALDFTTWLEKNVDLINEVLPLDLQPDSVRRENAAGAFSVDLVAEDASGDIVVIENQLERSDHNHLGKVLVYLSELKAKNAVWIVAEARSEHIGAVDWLNQSGLAKFWLLTIEAVRIGDSPYAPVLSLVTGPRDVQGAIQEVGSEKSVRDSTRQRFFEQLLELSAAQNKVFAGLKASNGPYQGATTGLPGINWVYAVRKDSTAVMLWIERGMDWVTWNQAVYEYFESFGLEIESAIGSPIEWDAKEANRSRKVIVRLSQGGWQNEDRWSEICDATVTLFSRFKDAVSPHLQNAVKSAGNKVAVDPLDDDSE